MKNIYFVSESIPYNSYGSFIIFYRHLLRLKENGFNVFLIVPNYENFEHSDYFEDINNHFNILRVPFNKWWYPPYRYNNKILRYIRFYLIHNLIKNKIKKNPPSFIITYFYGNFLNGFSVFLKNIYKCNIGSFLHDDKSLLNSEFNEKLIEYDQYIAKNSSIIWTVSEKLKISGVNNNYLVLPPIPGQKKLINKHVHLKKIIIGFSGSVYDSYFEVFQIFAKSLSKINGELHIITSNPERIKKNLNAHHNVKIIKGFKYSDDALQYLKDNCSALFCGYPDALKEMPWIYSCFPSKFIEYTRLNMPIILSGPSNIALTDWIKSNNWSLYLESISDKTVDQLLRNLNNRDFCIQMSNESKFVAENLFDADKIHRIFENTIIKSMDTYEN